MFTIQVCAFVCVFCRLNPARQGQGETLASPQNLPHEQLRSYLERKWKRIDAEEEKHRGERLLFVKIIMETHQQLYGFLNDVCIISIHPSIHLSRTAYTDTQTYLDSNNLVLRLHHLDKGEEKLPDARVTDEGDSLGSKASFGFTAQEGRGEKQRE